MSRTTDGPKKRLATIADVAARAGVSRSVVSRALSTEKRPISDDKRERVIKAAEELGFIPNPLAQSLTTKSVQLVAVIMNHVHDLSDLDLLDLLITRIQGFGKQVILICAGEARELPAFLREGPTHHVDAALVFSDFADAEEARQMFRTDCVIMLNGRDDDQSPTVVPEETAAINDAVRHAADKGARTAALVTGRTTSVLEQRRVADFEGALGAADIALAATFQGDYSYASGEKAAGAIAAMDPRPDAVFCTSDAMAMGIIDYDRPAFRAGAQSPFLLFGFDNLSLAGYGAYPLSTIGYDKAEYVDRIIDILEAMIGKRREPGEKPAPLRLGVEARFVPRKTG